jgi:hypothetical protein
MPVNWGYGFGEGRVCGVVWCGVVTANRQRDSFFYVRGFGGLCVCRVVSCLEFRTRTQPKEQAELLSFLRIASERELGRARDRASDGLTARHSGATHARTHAQTNGVWDRQDRLKRGVLRLRLRLRLLLLLLLRPYAYIYPYLPTPAQSLSTSYRTANCAGAAIWLQAA